MPVSTKTEDEKREEIVLDTTTSKMVEAGAGAGKTRLVVNSVINQIKTGANKPEEIVVITFTNKAAQEIRDRIYSAVDQALLSDQLTDQERERLSSPRLIDMQISTIHSFANKIISKYSLSAKLPIGIKLMENDDANQRCVDFFNNAYNQFTRNQIDHLSSEYILSKDFKNDLKGTFLSICDLPEDMIFRYNNQNYSVDDFKKDADQLIHQCLRELTDLAKARKPDLFANSQSFAGDVDALYHSEKVVKKDTLGLIEIYQEPNTNLRTYWKKFSAFCTKGSQPFNSKNKDVKPANADYSKAHIHDDLIAIEKKFNESQVALILNNALAMRQDYRQAINAPVINEISNNQLLELCRKILLNQDTRKQVQDQYHIIYLDEDQDTDIIQQDIINLICSDENGHIKPGSLVMVGDPKQSIYRFRGADQSLYTKSRKKMINESEIYELSNNYRSSPKILSWVDKNFSQIIKNQMGLSYYPMIGIDRPVASDVLEGVYTYSYTNAPAKTEEVSDEQLLVYTIKGLVHNPNIYIYDKDDNHQFYKRSIEYKDFMVLVYNTNHMQDYINKLHACGIPVMVDGKLSTDQMPSIRRVAILYKSLTNTKDKEAYMGALQILAHSRITDENEQEAKQRYQQLQEIAQSLDSVSLLAYLTHHIEWYIEGEINASQILTITTNLQQFYEKVISDAVNASEVNESINQYIAKPVEYELSSGDDVNAVTFMNLHKAKGLEHKIVIIAKRDTPKNKKGEAYRKGYDYYPTVIKPNQNGSSNSPSYDPNGDIAKAVEQENANERARLDYVAATRAEEALIFLNAKKKNGWFTNYDFKDTLNIRKAVNRIDSFINEQVDFEDVSHQYQDYKDVWSYNETDQQKDAVYTNINPSLLEHKDASWRNTSKEDRPTGNIFGNVLHKCMEEIAHTLRKNEKLDYKKIIAYALSDNFDDLHDDDIIKYHDYLHQCLPALMTNDFVYLIKNAQEVKAELPFSFMDHLTNIEVFDQALADEMRGKGATDQILINGQMDLFIKNTDGTCQIIDYKTDMLGNHTLKEFEEHLDKCYKVQQELYRYVVCHLFGYRKDDAQLTYKHLYLDN